eukprot:UN05691
MVGWGSELLSTPERIEAILKGLQRNNVKNLGITCKIRLLPDIRDTVELIKRLEHLGINACAIHCRYKVDRPRWQALPLMQMPLLSAISKVPLLYNGGHLFLS